MPSPASGAKPYRFGTKLWSPRSRGRSPALRRLSRFFHPVDNQKHTMRARFAIALTLLGSSLWPHALQSAPVPGQAPTPRNQGGFGDDRAFDGNAQAQRLNEELLGVWQLARADFTGPRATTTSTGGYLVVQDGTMALEMHLQSPDHLRQTHGLFFQTGVFRWQITPGGKLEAVSLIGTSNLTSDEKVEYEAPGTRREYSITLLADQLTLTKADRTTFVWRRVPKLPFPKANTTTSEAPGIPGAPAPPKKPAAPPVPRKP